MANKKNHYNYNYVFLLYDINEKRVHKVFKICKKYLYHHQKSVFRGPITTSKLMKLRMDLKNIINPEEDFISILKFRSDHYFDEETIGTNPKDSSDLFI